jgi:hypothetical protein
MALEAGAKGNLMAFRSVDEILKPDVRFADLYVLENGTARLMDISDHHRRQSRRLPDKPRYDETVDRNIIDPRARLSGIIDHQDRLKLA